MDLPIFLHLDLKGAPPLLSYLELLLPWLKERTGICGLLVEYEDQFPFQSPSLRVLSHPAAWTPSDVRRLQDLAASQGLQIVPLVQTLGHLEYVLKHEQFAHLREVPDLVECLCVTDCWDHEGSEVVALIREMMREVFELHPDCRSIHIGGDEVWHLGKGEKSTQMSLEFGTSPQDMYLRHMQTVVTIIRAVKPDVEILMWDDMLRSMSIDVLRFHSEFLRKVKPVVWQYTSLLNFPTSMWINYLEIFPSIYVASAFKGASSSCAKITPIRQHVNNHLAWSHMLTTDAHSIVNGLIITGWQRFDHFAALCELLPLGIPSLICCTIAFKKNEFTDEDLVMASKVLGISSLKSIDGQSCDNLFLQATAFPGAELFIKMQAFVTFEKKLEDFLNGDYVKTWCTDWHIKNGKVSVLHFREVSSQCEYLYGEGLMVAREMELCLPSYFPNFVAKEWMQCFARPLVQKLKVFLEQLKFSLQ